jgi:pimeloyl-ACP methyl ester carboxylesterase
MSKYLSVFRSEFGKNKILSEYDLLIQSIGILYEEKYFNTCLGKTHVIISGQIEKPPIVLIHAFYATAASWYQNLKELSEKFRVYTVDIIGDPNKSEPTKLIRNVNDFIGWFNDLMRELKLESAYFIGNSVGAFHVANFALHSPEKVKRMILIGPAATFRQIMPFYLNTFPGGMTGWSFLVRHAVIWIENGVPFESRFHKLFYLTLKYGKSANQVFPRVFKDDELCQIETPTLLIYGDKEVIYNVNKSIERAKKYLRNIKIDIIPNANHITAASNAKLTNASIIEFLNTNGN